MSLSIEITGKVHHIGETQQVSDKFRKRECVIHIPDDRNPQYDDFVSIQFGNDACSKLDGLNFQDEVKVQTNIRGRQYTDKKTGEIKFFNSLDGWKIEVVNKAQQPTYGMTAPAPISELPTMTEPEVKDADLPF